MKIQIKFFAKLRESLGCSELELDLPEPLSLWQLRTQLAARGEGWAQLEQGNLLMAINQSMCNEDKRLQDGDEVAFFPPVTGG